MAERDERGRFKKGASGNPVGRPRREQELMYLNALWSAVPESEWTKIMKQLVVLTRSGDERVQMAAISKLLEYLVPKPTETQDLTVRETQIIWDIPVPKKDPNQSG